MVKSEIIAILIGLIVVAGIGISVNNSNLVGMAASFDKNFCAGLSESQCNIGKIVILANDCYNGYADDDQNGPATGTVLVCTTATINCEWGESLESSKGECISSDPENEETTTKYSGTDPDSGSSDTCNVECQINGEIGKGGNEANCPMNKETDPDECFQGWGLGQEELAIWQTGNGHKGEFKGPDLLSDDDDVAFGEGIGTTPSKADCQALRKGTPCE